MLTRSRIHNSRVQLYHGNIFLHFYQRKLFLSQQDLSRGCLEPKAIVLLMSYADPSVNKNVFNEEGKVLSPESQ